MEVVIEGAEPGRITIYGGGLREWKRRDWGEGGEDFGWWCTEEPDAFVGGDPVYRSARDEIIELVGAHIYDLMVEVFEQPVAVRLPHPALRR